MYKKGWVEGKGLGRNETGMKCAIKVKIKRDQAGMGHDMAEEFTFQWWDHVFNRAANKIKLKGEDDSDESDSDEAVADGSFDITNKKPTKKYDPKHILYGRFVSGGLLVDENSAKLREMIDVVSEGNGAIVTPVTALTTTTNDADDSSESDDGEEEMKLYAAAGLPEEELLKRCGGRTAHKGARHGLKASAKLARIERQEGVIKLAADPKPEVSVAPSTVESPTPAIKKEKKHKKRSTEPNCSNETDEPPKKKSKKKKEKVLVESTNSEIAATNSDIAKACETEPLKTKKRKKKKRERGENNRDVPACEEPTRPVTLDVEPVTEVVKKKKKKRNEMTEEPPTPVVEKTASQPIANVEGEVKSEKKLKKKKKRDGAV